MSRKEWRKSIFIICLVSLLINLTSTTDALAQIPAGAVFRDVHRLTPLSIAMVDEAIATLEQGWAGMDTNSRLAFELLFDPGNTGEIDERFLQDTLANYRRIRRRFDRPLVVRAAEESDMCHGNRLFHTNYRELFVCPFFNQEPVDSRKARDLIHEYVHLGLFVQDRHYFQPKTFSSRYEALTPRGSYLAQLPLLGYFVREIERGDTLHHPDAYAWFALVQWQRAQPGVDVQRLDVSAP